MEQQKGRRKADDQKERTHRLGREGEGTTDELGTLRPLAKAGYIR
jgi:hypothetical protein